MAGRPVAAWSLPLRMAAALAALAALVGAGACADAATLSFSAVDPLLSELEVTVRSPSGIFTFGPNDYDRPCDDTASCVPATRPVRIASPGSVRVEATVVRDGVTLLDGRPFDVFVADGGETFVTLREGDPGLLVDPGPPAVILEGVGGFELYVYLDIS